MRLVAADAGRLPPGPCTVLADILKEKREIQRLQLSLEDFYASSSALKQLRGRVVLNELAQASRFLGRGVSGCSRGYSGRRAAGSEVYKKKESGVQAR